MKSAAAWLIFGSVLFAGLSGALALGPTEKVKVEIESVGLHPGMEPGMYVCAAGHLHIKGTVQNLADIPLGKIVVGGKAFGAQNELLGEATSTTKPATLAPGAKAEINLEFLTVSGPLIQQVKRHEVNVILAPPKQ